MIEYRTDDMPTNVQPTQPAHSAYICLFPSIGLKASGVGPEEKYLAEVYQLYPQADYYAQYSSTGNRAKPGEFVKYPPKSGSGSTGIINAFIKVYPGSKAYPNDNSYLRISNFARIFRTLAEHQGINELHVKLPTRIKAEREQYIQHLEDYLATSKLHGNNPIVYVYSDDEVPEPSAHPSAKPSTKLPSKPSIKLSVKSEQISSVTLYEIDFVRAVASGAEPRNILDYFPAGWDRIVSDSKLQQEADKINSKLSLEELRDPDIFPPLEDIFNAFGYLETEPKVVILGQDPYHGPGQAHGLSFSVKRGVPVPPSLRNIYSALENDPGVKDFKRPNHGCLEAWAKQGVIMLNTALTVKRGTPKSHTEIWERFTERLIQLLSIKYSKLIFVLWGGDAKKKRTAIVGDGHTILEFNHPSPMVKNNTFGTECRHFGQINELLRKWGKTPINWDL